MFKSKKRQKSSRSLNRLLVVLAKAYIEKMPDTKLNVLNSGVIIDVKKTCEKMIKKTEKQMEKGGKNA